MKSVILLSVILTITACGSSAENGSNSPEAANSTSNVAVARPNQNSANGVNMLVLSPAEIANYNTNSANKTTAKDPTSAPIKPTAMPAPDSSDYTTVMGKDGLPVETRVFRNSPQIAKVVKTWKSPKEKTISVYLKNGKVVELDGDKFENINSVPVAALLEAVGVKPQNSAPETIKDTKQKQ